MMRGVMNTKAFCAALLATTLLTGAASAAESQSTAHPALWPAAKSQGLVDPQTEAFVDSVLAKLTLEEKVGQMIQADIASITPDDLKTYPLVRSWPAAALRRWARRTARRSARGSSRSRPSATPPPSARAARRSR